MENFLLANGFGEPAVKKFVEQGLDLKQLCNLDNEKLELACEDAGLTLKEFKTLKSLLCDRDTIVSEEGRGQNGSFPKEIQSLVRENPFTDSLKFDNQVLERIFGFAWGEICIAQFKNYVTYIF